MINPARPPRMAPPDSPYGEPAALDEAVNPDRIGGVGRAGRLVPAVPRQQRGYESPVQPDHKQRGPGRRPPRARGASISSLARGERLPDFHVTRRCAPLCSDHSCALTADFNASTSFWNSTSATTSSARITTSLCGRSLCAAAARSRRLARFRRTAERRLRTARPSRGSLAGS